MSSELIEALEAQAERRADRRAFFKTALASAATFSAGAMFANAAQAQTSAVTDADIFNFALNLEYLEAQFYSFAYSGTGLSNSVLTGTQTRGEATGGRKAALSDPIVIQYAREIAADELAHVVAIRAALGSSAVAQPTIDISPAVFTKAAVAAGVDLTASGGTFDPYASDDNFLLGAFLFEDVGVTAYKGGSPLLQDVNLLDSAAGILAAEAFHAGLIRSALYRRGVATPALRTIAGQISDARDTLDGNVTSAGPPMRSADDDQGIAPQSTSFVTSAGTSTGTGSNIVPADSNSVAYSRTTEQVHNIVYLTSSQTTAGGFFPNGTNNANAALRRSGAN